MLIEFQEYLTFENIYLWANFGILPFWLMIVVIPNSKFTQFFINSIILPLILSTAYIYTAYQAFLLDEPISDILKIYFNLDNLYTVLLMFSDSGFLDFPQTRLALMGFSRYCLVPWIS